MQQTNLNYLFIDKVPNFAHLLTTQPQTKSDFLQAIQKANEGTKLTALFYIATEKSDFLTIRLSDDKNTILFNQ